MFEICEKRCTIDEFYSSLQPECHLKRACVNAIIKIHDRCWITQRLQIAWASNACVALICFDPYCLS